MDGYGSNLETSLGPGSQWKDPGNRKHPQPACPRLWRVLNRSVNNPGQDGMKVRTRRLMKSRRMGIKALEKCDRRRTAQGLLDSAELHGSAIS